MKEKKNLTDIVIAIVMNCFGYMVALGVVAWVLSLVFKVVLWAVASAHGIAALVLVLGYAGYKGYQYYKGTKVQSDDV